MDSIKLKYWVNVGLIISFLAVAATGIIKFPGLLLKIGINVKNLPFGKISKVHDWAGIAMSLLVLVHLIQNWSWIVAMTKKIFKNE
ncbi:DUF4405 domain-containing protein [Candidatus Woesearchaeota archaeon]|nr:DUF4405 domain-containing protein [Candidatus Woesearchaeota archaeon]